MSTDVKFIGIDSNTPLFDETMSMTIGDIVETTSEVGMVGIGHCGPERIIDVVNKRSEIENRVIERINELTKNDGEYYVLLGHVVVDLAITFLIGCQEAVDIANMMEELE